MVLVQMLQTGIFLPLNADVDHENILKLATYSIIDKYVQIYFGRPQSTYKYSVFNRLLSLQYSKAVIHQNSK